MRTHTQNDMQIGMYTHAKYHENKHANTYYIHDNTQSTGLHTCIHAYMHSCTNMSIRPSTHQIRAYGASAIHFACARLPTEFVHAFLCFCFRI